MSLKKPFVLAALLLFPLICGATAFDDRYGIGTVHIIPYNFFALDLYSHVNDDAPFDEISFSKDKQTQDLHYQFATASVDTFPSWFAPEYFNTTAKNFRIELICLEKQNDWCKVLLNPATGFTKWIHLGADVTYYDWTTFFNSVVSVDIVSGDAKLYSKSSLTSNSEPLLTKLEAGGTQLIQPQKTDGAWMEVKVIKFTYNMEQTTSTIGWIMWHDDAGPFISWNISLD